MGKLLYMTMTILCQCALFYNTLHLPKSQEPNPGLTRAWLGRDLLNHHLLPLALLIIQKLESRKELELGCRHFGIRCRPNTYQRGIDFKGKDIVLNIFSKVVPIIYSPTILCEASQKFLRTLFPTLMLQAPLIVNGTKAERD